MNHKQTERPRKRTYLKPELMHVSLRPEEAVLGNCKSAGTSGPAHIGDCTFPANCNSVGS